jgi:hypothetical protein
VASATAVQRMKNGKPSLIFDIRYFSGRATSYLDDHAVTAYGRRLAWYLNSHGVSLGAYHSLYVHFSSATPSGVIAIDPYKGGDELWWLRYVRVGVPPGFPNIKDANEIAVRETIAALRILLPDDGAMIERADTIVRQHASDLRFLIRERTYKRYTLRVATTITDHPEPSQLYVTVVENTTGAHCETSSIPIGFYANAFDEALSVSLKDLDIGLSEDGRLKAEWCQRIRSGWPAGRHGALDQPEPHYSRLVRRQ